MKHTDKPGGKARRLRPLTDAERAAVSHLAATRNPAGGYDAETSAALAQLEAAGFFTPPPEARRNGRAWNDAMLRILLLRTISARRDCATGNCYPNYETTAHDAGIPGGGRHVQRLAERLLLKPGYLGRTFSAAKGSPKTIRFYDFAPMLAAAEIVESGWMPTIDPPAWNPCNRSDAEAIGARDCNRTRPDAIATAPAPNPCNRSGGQPLQPLSRRTLATAQEAAANIPLNNPKEQVNVFEHAPPASSGFEVATPSPATDFAAWAATQKDPVAVALAASGEGDETRRSYGSRLSSLRALKGWDEGARLFVAECVTFHAELRAGEKCENPGATLNARLGVLIDRLKGAAVAETSTPPAPPPCSKEPEPVAAPPTPEPKTPPPADEDTPPAFASVAEAKRETPENADAVAVALWACEGGEGARALCAELLAVFQNLPAQGESGFVSRCRRYAETKAQRTPEGLAAFLRGLIPPAAWKKAEDAARDSKPTPAKRETKPARRPCRAPATPPEAQGEPEPPTDAAPGLTAKQVRILACVEDARCDSAQEARTVALNYPEEDGATADDADAVLAVWEARRAEAV